MAKIKVSELQGVALDWAVAKCDGRRIRFNLGGGLEVRGRTEEGNELPEQWDLWMPWHPKTNWAQGGPIIERERIGFLDNGFTWFIPDTIIQGTSPLIVAMRYYVLLKLGSEVDIPEELLEK